MLKMLFSADNGHTWDFELKWAHMGLRTEVNRLQTLKMKDLSCANSPNYTLTAQLS